MEYYGYFMMKLSVTRFQLVCLKILKENELLGIATYRKLYDLNWDTIIIRIIQFFV